MYKLLLVEDEPIERQAIRLMVSKNCPQISEIQEAQDGYAALECCKLYAPDIIMLDINMPGLNGLETIRELQNKPGMHAKFLILSSYDRFDYAREALQLGVEDFILKPAKIARLQEAIAQTVQKIESERQHKQESSALTERVNRIRPIVESDCVYALISGDETALLDTFFSFLNVEVKSGFCLLVACEKMPQFLLAQLKTGLQNLGILVIGQRYNNRLVFFILSETLQTPDEAKQVEQYVALYLAKRDIAGAVATGGICQDAARLHDSYREARGAQKQQAARAEMQPENKLDLRLLAAQQEQLLLQAGTQPDHFEQLANRIVLGVDFWQAREILYRLLIVGAKFAEEHSAAAGDVPVTPFEEIADLRTPRELCGHYKAQLCEMHRMVQTGAGGDMTGVARDTLEYLDAHYCEAITLEDIAAHLQLTANYISKALKKQTGQNFSDLLTQKRIRRAKQLLAESYSVKEVTYLTGFNSQNYFAKSFKKEVGITPREYKQKR